MKVRAPLPGSRPAPTRDVAQDTRRRFLAAIVARVPLERISEIHVFPPIKQGGIETGFAVVAALPDGYSEPLPAAPSYDEQTAASDGLERDESIDAVEAAEAVEDTEPVESAEVVQSAIEMTDDPISNEDSPYAAELPVLDVEELLAPVDDDERDDEDERSGEEAADAPPAERPLRHVVFSARYRLTLKGPERGRWESEIVAEADAPLVTVDAVVRGVQRRAGEPADAERLDRAGLAAALEEFPWKAKTP